MAENMPGNSRDAIGPKGHSENPLASVVNNTSTSTPGAHHAPSGRFRNPWPNGGPPSARDVLRLLFEFRSQRRERTPGRGTFPVAQPSIIYPRRAERDF